MALKRKTFSLLGIIFCVACLIALIISFASDKWVVSTETEVIGFKHIGLWSVCFDQYWPPAWALIDRSYTGCWWVLDKELELLRHYLFPSWFVGTQVLVTIGLVFELLAVIGQVVNAINCFPYSDLRDKIALGLSYGTAALHGLTGILLSIAVIMFGIKAMNSRSWLEHPDQNYLSWSYGFCVLAAFLAIIAGLCQLFEALRQRIEQGADAEPAVFLTNHAPPESRYAYTPQKVPPPANPRANSGYPAYANRYKGSQSSLAEPRPPDSLFAVSGAGDVYINHLAEYDEGDYGNNGRSRQMGRAGGNYNNGRYPLPSSNYATSTSDSRHPDLSDSRNPTRPLTAAQNGSYRRANQSEHKVLPEYVPRAKQASEEDESESDVPEKPALDSDVEQSHRKKKNKKSKDSDNEGGRSKSRRSSSKKSKKGDKDKRRDSDEESTGSRRHRKKSKHRSRSRDLNTSRDSDTSGGRSRSGSRSRRRSRSRSKERGLDSDGEKSRRRSGSKQGRKGEGKSSKRDGYLTDETVGSGRSSKRKSKHRTERDYSDGESVRGRSKRRTDRDYSDGESVRGRTAERSSTATRPKHSYSSYYEY